MSESVEKFPALRLTREGRQDVEEEVARELPLTIILNDQELVTMLCTPDSLRYLAVGFLYSEGLVEKREDITEVTVDSRRGVVRVKTAAPRDLDGDFIYKRVITSGCGRGASFYSAADVSVAKVESRTQLKAEAAFALAREFQHSSKLYLATHGVHSAALCDQEKVLVFSEDIGRHNAVDKIFGQCLLESMDTRDRILITSGRLSSEILHKVARRGVPIIISISAPTSLGVSIADALGMTLIASARGQKMSVYTHPWRVIADGQPEAGR